MTDCELMKLKKPLCAIKGAGDLATGVGVRLFEAGYPLVMTEISQPLVVRRAVSFAEAVFKGEHTVCGIRSVLSSDLEQARTVLRDGDIPILIDPSFSIASQLSPKVVIDARMIKRFEAYPLNDQTMTVGLGPGFSAGQNCHAVIETNRGPALGAIIWQGEAEKDTGIPGEVLGKTSERVYFAENEGVFTAFAEIGDVLEPGQPIGKIGRKMISNRFKGVLRGCLHSGLTVVRGEKLADVDPRLDRGLAFMPSDKAFCIGDAVVRAVSYWLSQHG